ncbi:MAG TPA: hypothetical protein VE465_17005 [Streptosporangiaceae bacterium]|nr:hypothetical protein [Streptosporangiaceae bacterium]
MTSALAINLLSSLLAFLLGGAARGLHQRWKAVGPARRVWRLGRSAEVVLALSDGPGHATTLPTLYEGDAEAAGTVAAYLRSVCGARTRIIRASTFSRVRDAHSDLVVIGGARANGLYKEIDRRVSMPYRFTLYRDRADLVRLADGRVFAQEVMHAKTVRDFAAISFLPSPFDPDRRIVILAGCGMQATVAAAKMVTADGIRKIARLRPPVTPFSVVIEIEIIDGQATKPHITDVVHWSIRA